jgi:ADP-ribose pyrophosphatase YjhB (NUDIX family)
MHIRLLHHLMAWSVWLLVPRRRVGVALVVLNNAGQVLLLRHVFHPAAPWGLPGGWLNRRETPAQGALRELHEETGLVARLGPVIYVKGESQPDHIGIAYMGYVEGTAVMQLSSEIIEAVWFERTQLPTSLQPFVQTAIQTALHLHDTGNGLNVQ